MSLKKYEISSSDIIILIIVLFLTYFVFELNKEILDQLKELKISATKLKKEEDFFRNKFLACYFDNRIKNAKKDVYLLYILPIFCFIVYVLTNASYLFFVFFIIFLTVIFYNFSLDNDRLPVYRALIESNNVTEFLEQLDIRRGTDKYDKVLTSYEKINLKDNSEKEKTELIDDIFEELPY